MFLIKNPKNSLIKNWEVFYYWKNLTIPYIGRFLKIDSRR